MPDDGPKTMGLNRNWWYAIAGVAGLLGYLWYRNYKANQAAQSALTAAIPVPTGGTAGSTTTSFAPASNAAGSVLSTLNDWMSQAQQWAVSSLGQDPAAVQNALQNYANGNCLSSSEFRIVDQAIGQLGQPPNAPYQGVVLCSNAPQASTTVGFGQTTVGNTPYTILGILNANDPHAFEGYQVSGGAPVFFLAPGSDTPTQGTGQAVAGAQVLVPSIYNQFVAASPNPYTPTHA